MNLSIVLGGEETWYRGDDNDMKAKAAFEALLRLRIYWPETEEFSEFSNEVKTRAQQVYGYDFGNEKVRSDKHYVCVCVCVRACVRACVLVCVRACVLA